MTIRDTRCVGVMGFCLFLSRKPLRTVTYRDILLWAGLMGFCLFHSCKEVSSLATADLAANGVTVSYTADGAPPRHFFAPPKA